MATTTKKPPVPQEARRGPGRPPRVGGEGATTTVIRIRLTATEVEAFEATAGQEGVAPWLRRLGRRAAHLDT